MIHSAINLIIIPCSKVGFGYRCPAASQPHTPRVPESKMVTEEASQEIAEAESQIPSTVLDISQT